MFKEKNSMKAKMKKLISIRSIPILALALLIVLGSALAAGRDPVSGSGTALLDLGTEPPGATGTATLTIGGGEPVETSFTLTMDSMAWKDEVLHITATHTFTLPGGTFITSDKGVVDTDGTLNENLTITGGTGDYDGACGELRVHGQVQFTSPTTAEVSFDIHGVIYR